MLAKRRSATVGDGRLKGIETAGRDHWAQRVHYRRLKCRGARGRPEGVIPGDLAGRTIKARVNPRLWLRGGRMNTRPAAWERHHLVMVQDCHQEKMDLQQGDEVNRRLHPPPISQAVIHGLVFYQTKSFDNMPGMHRLEEHY